MELIEVSKVIGIILQSEVSPLAKLELIQLIKQLVNDNDSQLQQDQSKPV